MTDFESWEDVKVWLEDPNDNYQTVSYHAWIFSKSSMSCTEEGCCSDEYETVDDAVESIKYYSGNRLELVEKDD